MKPLSDYSFIRGFNYMWQKEENWDKELGYAIRLQLNSARIWLNYKEWEQDAAAYEDKLRRFVRAADEKNISVVPILFNGNGVDPAILDAPFSDFAARYVSGIVAVLKDEKGLLMWDIMNEPSCNDYIRKASEAEREDRFQHMWDFVIRICNQVKEADPVNAITVGNTFIWETEPTAAVVDVISFHDYSPTRTKSEKVYEQAVSFSKKYSKPIVNNEMACLCRANPYDMAIGTADKYQVGWYIFELMIHGYWGDVHGVFYPDGTIRDPAIVAAIMGFHRNRSADAIRPNPNKEVNVREALDLVREALSEEAEVFRAKKRSAEELLEAAEYCANLLEGCEMVPMIDPPSAKILQWRDSGFADINVISQFTYDLALKLKENCQIL